MSRAPTRWEFLFIILPLHYGYLIYRILKRVIITVVFLGTRKVE